MHDDTLDGTQDRAALARRARPGLLAIFSDDSPTWIPIPLLNGTVTVGRGTLPGDPRLSRAHAEISFSAEGWTVRDLGSRNGTSVDGRVVVGTVVVAAPKVVRLADTILLCVEDLSAVGTPHAAGRIIVGTLLARALEEIARAAAYSRTLVLRGESGTGKELGAREFHERGPHAKGPFVAVNCAAIPGGLAERLLFGTKRGAYSGAAADADGHLASAHGGVLFLDEVAELDLDAQAKLLRVLETGDVLPLGAQKAQQVDVRVCVATHRNLREEVTAGRFREDLYYRLAPPEVVLPPLRERGDEMVAHIVAEVASASGAVRIHPTLIEACLSRTWPGNVRELRKHVRQAAMGALAAKADRVRAGHLSDVAGLAIAQASQGEPSVAPSPTATPPGGVTDKVEKTESESGKPGDGANAARKRSYTRWSASLTREQIEAALASNGGSMAAAARSLGMNRSQLYREMARHSIASGSDGSESA